MSGDGPYRAPGGPKPEQIVEFSDSIDENCRVIESAVKKANAWLKENTGRIEIFKREVAQDNRGYFNRGYFRAILIWYREKE
jgi:hypothetical protein